MKLALLGLLGLLALATAYPYPSFSRYRPVPEPRYRYPEQPAPAANDDSDGEFKGLVNALVQSMDHSETQEEEHQESYFRQPAPDRFGYSNDYNDLVNALSEPEEQPAWKPSAQEKAETFKVELQSHQREVLNEVEEELRKHQGAKPGTKEYEEAMKVIRAKFPHSGHVCPDGSLEDNCLQSVCQMGGISCPAHVEAVCKDDYCGGCDYYFVLKGKRLTREECYSTEGLEEQVYQSAKQVLAQYGNDMEYEELMKKVNERLDIPQTHNYEHPIPEYQPAEVEEDDETANYEELLRRIQEKLNSPEYQPAVEEQEDEENTNYQELFGEKLDTPQSFYERPDPESQSQTFYERPVPEYQPQTYERPVPEYQPAYKQRYPEPYQPRYEDTGRQAMEPRPRFGSVEMAPGRYGGMNGGYRDPYQRRY